VQTRLDSWFRISLSADGTLAASAGSDFAVSVWEVATGKELLKLPPHKDHVYGAAFSPDGRYLASGGRSNPIHLWELATGQQVFTLPAQDYLFAFAPDGRTLVSGGGSYDGAIPLWDLATGKERRSLGRHDRNLSALAFSRDGRLLATASEGGAVKLWDMAAGREKLTLPGHDGGAAPVAFLPDGRTLLVRAGTHLNFWDIGPPARDGEAWTVKAGRRLDGAGNVLALTADRKMLASGQSYRNVYLWDVERGAEVQRLGEFGDIGGAAFAPDGKTVVVSGYGSVILADVSTGKAVRKWEAHKARSIAVAFSPDGKTLVTAGTDGDNLLRFWDPATGKEIRQAQIAVGRDSSSRRVLVFSPSGRTLAVGGDYSKLQLWDAEVGRRVHELPVAGAFALSPDSKTLATAGKNHAIQLWEVATGASFAELHGHEGAIAGLAFSADGRVLASGGADNTVLLWDVRLERLHGRAAAKLGEKELAGCWDALAGADARPAYEALARLTAQPETSVAYVKNLLRPAPAVPAERIKTLIAGLGTEQFAAREEAFAALQRLGSPAGPLLRQALRDKPELEVVRRIEMLLEGMGNPEVLVPPGDALRVLRALEQMGTPEARKLLEQLAGGAAEATLTQDAKAALERLARREGKRP
jgi:WD40 repeat protein